MLPLAGDKVQPPMKAIDMLGRDWLNSNVVERPQFVFHLFHLARRLRAPHFLAFFARTESRLSSQTRDQIPCGFGYSAF
jgi:hypothetical protein